MDKNKSLRAQVIEMRVGEKLIIPLDEYGYTTVRTYASELGFAEKKIFSTKRNRKDRTYIITRLA